MLWLDPRPLPEDLIKAYAEYHTHGRTRARSTAQLGLSALNATCKVLSRALDAGTGLGRQRRGLRFMFLARYPRGRLLEIGCGSGRFLQRMRRKGWAVQGVDLDPVVAKRIQERYGLSIDVGDLRALGYPAESFDAVAMSQVIEHAYDPVGLLAECRRLLRPGGHLVLSTPNARSLAHRRFARAWRGLEPPRHLQIFTRQALESSTQRVGLRIERITTLSAESAGIYRASEEAQLALGLAVHGTAVGRVVRSWALRYAEYAASRSDPDAGQDLFMIACR